ncbi:MAG: histone deacetylase [Spirochaetia bacterium]|nr:histone deacetylase [Spirochaetia bacterium]
MQKNSSSEPSPVFVYSSGYDMDLGPHVFPSVKFGFLYARLVDNPKFKKHRFHEPEPLEPGLAGLVHIKPYLQDLNTLTMSPRLNRSELPLNRDIVDAFYLACGGTLLAARLGLEHGRAMNLSGGFHHSYHDHAEGFCYLNDVAIAIRVLQKERKIRTAIVVDLDVHQGNGTAKIFTKDDSVFTFSMHEQNNYPVKEESDLDVGIETGCRDEQYLAHLSQSLHSIKQRFVPDIVFYLAGVDPYEHDRLGGLSITKKGMAERDRMVRDFMPGVPLVTLLAGGYAENTMDTIDLHYQTCEVLAGIR